jgi:hypothetical protein
MEKVLKIITISLLMMGLIGCLTVNSLTQSQIKQTRQGDIVIVHLKDYEEPGSMQKACGYINNKDPRCKEMDKYQVISGCSKFGYWDGCVGAIAVAPKEMDVGQSCVTGSSQCTYVRVHMEPHQLATVTEVLSRPGDKKCDWSGLPRIGGVVCKDPKWDYHHDNQAAVYFRD